MALITEHDDRTLVEQHRAGDDDAFRRIVLRHHRSVYANALRRLRDPGLAEDAVQETFLRAFRSIDRFDGKYHLDAWLHRIVTNACHDIGRRQGRDTRLFDRACTEVEIEAPAADQGLDAVPREHLADALESLPETYREVLLLRFVEELSYEDVAEKAGITEQNARARVSRGRSMLRKMMSSTGALIVWAIPPLRRSQSQLTGTEAEVAHQAASHAHTLSGLTNVASTTTQSMPAGSLTQLSNLVAQAAPTIATAAPAVTSSAPTLGKTAVAVGIAASVVIPTGVAVDRARDKPPAAAAPAIQEVEAGSVDPGAPVTTAPSSTSSSSIAPSSTTGKASVGPLGAGAPEVLDEGSTTTTGSSSTTETTDTTDTTDTTEAPSSTSTTTPGSSIPGGGPVTEAPGGSTTSSTSTTTTTAPAPPPSGDLSATVAVSEAGPRLVLSGPITLVVGDRTVSGILAGKSEVLVDEANAKNPRAPRQVDGSLNLHLDGGIVADLDFFGTAVVTEDGTTRSHALSVNYRLSSADELGLKGAGHLDGSLDVTDSQGRLRLTLPGQPG